MTTSATPLSRLRALWLSRRSRCPGCGYDLAGLTVDDEGICPECGRAVTRSWASSVTIGADGRDSLARIIRRAAATGLLIVLPWLAWIAFFIWRLSLQRRPSQSAVALMFLALAAYSLALFAWSAHEATRGSARLFHFMMRALLSIGVTALAAWLVYVVAWWTWRVLQ